MKPATKKTNQAEEKNCSNPSGSVIKSTNLATMSNEIESVKPIILPLVYCDSEPEVLIFNIDDIKKLRNDYNILGLLTGTLQQYPQQNIFLSVPMKLVIWEVLWLVKTRKPFWLIKRNTEMPGLPVV